MDNQEDDPHRKMTPKASGVPLTDFSKISEERTALASWHAKLILGSYRADQANDPDIYVTAIAHLLLQYPAEIGAQLTDPRNGVAGEYKWLPTVSEVKEAADKIIETRDANWRREEMLHAQMKLRDQIEAEQKDESPEHRQKATKRILGELRQAFADHHGEVYNVFVPTSAPQYRNMLERGGHPGVSLEDKTRDGVWVPQEWLTTHTAQQKAKPTWQRLSAADLLAKYPPKYSEAAE